jgi:hypothetical protein
MFPWKTVGMHAPSYSSNALCVRRMEDSPRIQPTDTALMTFRTTWYYVAHYGADGGRWGDQAV